MSEIYLEIHFFIIFYEKIRTFYHDNFFNMMILF